MEQQGCAFFLGANGRNGFFSLTDQLRREPGVREVWTLKSGPGSGKSTVLGRLGDALADGGRREELLCSSDPASRDGVLLHGRGLLLVDGTAPHVTEPRFPGAGGDYLTLPPPLDPAGLRAEYPALLAWQALAERSYAAAYARLRAAALVEDDVRRAMEPFFPAERLLRRADGLLRREIPRGPGAGVLRTRFLDGMTPGGRMFLRGTIGALCPRVCLIDDRFGLAQPLLAHLRDGALARGQEVYAALSPLDPARTLHLLLPGCGWAFLTEDGTRMPDAEPARRLRLDAALAGEGLAAARVRVRRLLRLRDGLLDEATAALREAHEAHERMEAIYRPHIDFAAQDAAVRRMRARILGEA